MGNSNSSPEVKEEIEQLPELFVEPLPDLRWPSIGGVGNAPPVVAPSVAAAVCANGLRVAVGDNVAVRIDGFMDAVIVHVTRLAFDAVTGDVRLVAWKWFAATDVKRELQQRRHGAAWAAVAHMQGETSLLAAQLAEGTMENVLFQSDVMLDSAVLELVHIVPEVEVEDVRPLTVSRFIFRYRFVPETAQIAFVALGTTLER